MTEKVSISKLLDKVGMGKNAVTYLLKNALAEGSEEMASDAVNWLADVMISQDKSEWEETLLYYRALGFSEDEAFLAAMKEQGRKMLKDGAAGAITGTITAGGRLAGSKIGDGIQSYRNYREAVQNGKQYYALNQLTQGGLARSLGNMNVEQSYRSMSPETILKNSGLSPTEARFLLESNGYSVEKASELGGMGDSSLPKLTETDRVSSIQRQTQNFAEGSQKNSILSEEILQKIEENAIMMRESGLPRRLDLPDEILQRTVDVSLPELHGIVPEGSALQEVKIMAGEGTSSPIRDVARLYATYPDAGPFESWQKKTGTAFAKHYRYVVHWYENGGTVPVNEVKLKGKGTIRK